MISIIWALVGIVIMALEAVVPGFAIFFFGLGAFITALATLIPGVGSAYALQAIIWAVSSLVSFAFLRKKLVKVFQGKLIEKTVDDAIGKKAKVIERITPNQAGRISFEGTSWKAESFDETIEIGEEVEVLQKENLTCIVTKNFLE